MRVLNQNTIRIGLSRRTFQWLACLLALVVGPVALEGGQGLHPFKMSICEVIYAPQRKVFDIKCYLFQDDLREAMYNDPINGDLGKDPLSAYIFKNIELRVNGQRQNMNFQDLRYKGEQVLVQFSTDAISATSITEVGITNRLLLDKFSSQINMVYLYYPDEQTKHTKKFDIHTTQDVFKL